MTVNFKDLIRLTASARYKSRKMRHQLILYWCSMALVLFGILLLILSLTGVFSNSEQNLSRLLEIRESNVCADLGDHLDTLEAQAIALSENASSVIEDAIYMQPISTLNDQPRQLFSLQRSLYGPLSTSLNVSPCSGAFIVLDATTNTSAPEAETSRTGLYLRFANLSATKSAHQDVVFFRGIPDIAREIPLELHNRWNLEFDTTRLHGYSKLIKQTSGRLANSCIWSQRLHLPGTWEDVILLTVPIRDKNGTVNGVCGLEISKLYFQLAYPSMASEFGNMITLLAPLDGDTLLVDSGMIGGLEGTQIDTLTTLEIKEGEQFNIYTCSDETYLGIHRQISANTAEDLPLVAVTLIPLGSFNTAVKTEHIMWIIGTFVFLMATLILALYLSRRFVKPITTALDSICNNTQKDNMAATYVEINDLFDFLAQKDREYEEGLRLLSQEKQNAQIETARIQTEYTKSQAEIARLAYARKKEIDPVDYQRFLDGLHTLTQTERKIFEYYLSGKNAKEIMEIASIKESTLRYHNRNIYSKLGVNSLKQMLRYATLMKQQNEEGSDLE